MGQHNSEKSAVRRLIPVTQWNQYHDWPPQGGLRHLIFFEHTNGFHEVIRRVGRRVLIDEEAFFQWIEKNRKFIEFLGIEPRS